MTQVIDVELIKFLDGMRKDIEATKATVAVVGQQLIELRNELNDFRQDILSYRSLRAQAEISDLESRTMGTQSRVDILKGGSGGTDERIKKAVETELKKRGIDWRQVFQIMVQSVMAFLAVAVAGVLFWKLVNLLALNSP